MYKKGIILLSSIFLLAACGGEETTETTPEEPVAETEAEPEVETDAETEEVEEDVNNESVETNDTNHTYDALVDETTFSEEYGLQAWADYQAVVNDSNIGEITELNQESVNSENINGSSSNDIKELFDALDLREDVFQDEVEVSENEKLVFYRYPPAEDSEYNEVAMFLAESTFYFYDDNLVFTSITPGLYSVDLTNAPNVDDLMLFLTVDEIREIEPQIYTIAQMQVNGEKIEQVMIPAMGTDEEGNETLMAFYFFTKGEDILQYGYIPFEMVSQDFPTSSILLFNEVVPELESL